MSTPQTGPQGESDERLAARLTDYLDGELDDAAAAELDALLDDEALRGALDDARGGQDLLRGLQRPPVPRDFLRKVQRRVRRRSGGRYFHPVAQPFGWRLSVEVFVVVAIAVMAGCWFVMDAGRRAAAPSPIVDESPAGIEAPAAPERPAEELPERTKGATLAPPAGEQLPARAAAAQGGGPPRFEECPSASDTVAIDGPSSRPLVLALPETSTSTRPRVNRKTSGPRVRAIRRRMRWVSMHPTVQQPDTGSDRARWPDSPIAALLKRSLPGCSSTSASADGPFEHAAKKKSDHP